MNELNYVRPFQVRDIPLKASSYRGEIVATKPHLKEELSITTFSYESGLERDLYICLDHDYHCCDLQPLPAEVIWTNKEEKECKTYPNCWAAFITGKQILFKIKSIEKLQELEGDENWQRELNAINKYCQERAWELKIIDERYIRTPRSTNIMLLRRAAMHSPNSSLIEKIKEVLPSLYRKGIGIAFSDLAKRVTERTGFPVELIQFILEYLIYYQYLYFDWNMLFTKKTLIFLNFDYQLRAEPFYEIQPVIQKNSFKDAQPVKVDMDLSRLLPNQIQEADKRLDAIRPLLEKTNRTKLDVQKRAKEIGKGYVTLYHWMKAFEKEGWWGIVPKDFNKGNKEKRFCDEVEEIMKKEINYYYKGLISISACLYNIKAECKKNGFSVPSYKSVSTRIQNTPAKGRLGKQGGFIRNEISQSIVGELSTGMRPLDFIQMDHCELDIELVDQVYRKPAGRPYLTMAIDTYSRMIYGYFISFDNPNSLSITRSLLTGIMPKEELLKKFDIDAMYPIHGMPIKVQVDNSMDFRSKNLELFCRSYNIDLEFRPVRRPDKGGYVERLFGTINRRIRDDGLNGYTPPLKTRPDNYDPIEKAEKGGMTIPEFEKWLIVYFVKDYHINPHDGLRKSPLEQYQSGILGLDLRPGIQPIVPHDLEKLKFDILPISGWHRLNSYGIQWLGNRYNSRDLARIRKKIKGDSSKIQFRFDPSDIRKIWIYDDENRSYYPIPIASGNLAQFVCSNSDIPVSLSEVKKINHTLKENRIPINSSAFESALAERREWVEDAAKRSRSARKENEKKKKPPVISMKPCNFNEDEIMKDVDEDDLLPPLLEDTAKMHALNAKKEDDKLLSPLQESLPRIKKREGWEVD